MKDGSPFIVVSLLPARSADPPHSSGSTGASSFKICPEAFLVATPFSLAGKTGSASAQPSGSSLARSRASSLLRPGLADDHAANESSQAACSCLPRSATLRACATSSSQAGKDTSGSKPRTRLVAATSSAPSAEPCAAPVSCLSGAGQPMMVRRPMIDGAAV